MSGRDSTQVYYATGRSASKVVKAQAHVRRKRQTNTIMQILYAPTQTTIYRTLVLTAAYALFFAILLCGYVNRTAFIDQNRLAKLRENGLANTYALLRTGIHSFMKETSFESDSAIKIHHHSKNSGSNHPAKKTKHLVKKTETPKSSDTGALKSNSSRPKQRFIEVHKYKFFEKMKESMFKKNQTLLTLFTTLKPDIERNMIHRNMIQNWALLHQYNVDTILYVTPDLPKRDSSLIPLAKEWGWIVRSAPRITDSGVPFLKDMYQKAEEVTHSIYYAYANGDILFDRSILATLNALGRPKRPTLLVGQRKNYHYGYDKSFYSLWHVQQAAIEASLFEPFAEDYFIASRGNFPWDSMPDFVIGRPMYDNYLVAYSKKHEVETIDVTQTLTALHLSGIDGDFAGQKSQSDEAFNRMLVNETTDDIKSEDGFTHACRFFTSHDRHKNITLMRAHHRPKYAFSKKFYPNKLGLQVIREKELHLLHMLMEKYQNETNDAENIYYDNGR